MYIPKRYGETSVNGCPFCGRQAIVENEQGVPVCKSHKDTLMPEVKCVCGEYLFMQKGKFGIYFNCLRCGNISMKKVLEMNDITKPMPPESIQKINDQFPLDKPAVKGSDGSKAENKMSAERSDNKPKNIIIRSDDPDYFD